MGLSISFDFTTSSFSSVFLYSALLFPVVWNVKVFLIFFFFNGKILGNKGRESNFAWMMIAGNFFQSVEVLWRFYLTNNNELNWHEYTVMEELATGLYLA